MFQQFNKAGHRMLSAEIQQELQALAQRHGLNITAGGGQIGTDELVIKVTAKTNDTSAIEARERRELGIYGRFAGLTEHHYNAIIHDRRTGEQYQLKGYSPNRPKYPIDMLNLRTGRMHKATESYARQFIIAANAAQVSAPAVAAAHAAAASPTPQTPPPGAMDLGSAASGLPAF
jgi:hypothetical protein